MFNARKSAQVIAYFALKNHSRTIPVLKAVKLVYISDRESIKYYGYPILDEDRVSMKHGPVNSETYSHINGEHDLSKCGWSDFLETPKNYEIKAVERISASDLDELSAAEMAILDSVWERFKLMDRWTIRDWTHVRANIPEWEDPGNTSVLIPIERIMSAVGLTAVEENADLLSDHEAIDRVFASLAK
jgi:uncharacterized phage-associated protein